MRRQDWRTIPALVGVVVLTAALIDVAAIITMPLRSLVAWMLP